MILKYLKYRIKHIFQFICCIILLTNALSANTFENQFNHYSGKQLNRLKVCGERCSGTNYTTYLLHANFPSLAETDLLEFGQKHFMYWYGSPIDNKKLTNLRYQPNAVNLNGSNNCLFVVVVRNPYDWLRSFYLTPSQVSDDLIRHGFLNFISSEWKTEKNYHPLDGQYHEIDDFNPCTGKPFTNILELRKHKIINYLKLGRIVKNFLFVRYEDIRDNSEMFINFVAKYYRLVKKNDYIPIKNLKGSHVPFIQKFYDPLTSEELDFINGQLDWVLENKIGYFINDQLN